MEDASGSLAGQDLHSGHVVGSPTTDPAAPAAESGTPPAPATAAAPAKPTKYLVFEETEGVEDGDEVWKLIGYTEARNSQEALRLFWNAGGAPDPTPGARTVAVSERSWQPKSTKPREPRVSIGD